MKKNGSPLAVWDPFRLGTLRRFQVPRVKAAAAAEVTAAAGVLL
jgi:hypothetical protein